MVMIASNSGNVYLLIAELEHSNSASLNTNTLTHSNERPAPHRVSTGCRYPKHT